MARRYHLEYAPVGETNDDFLNQVVQYGYTDDNSAAMPAIEIRYKAYGGLCPRFKDVKDNCFLLESITNGTGGRTIIEYTQPDKFLRVPSLQ